MQKYGLTDRLPTITGFNIAHGKHFAAWQNDCRSSSDQQKTP